MSSERLRGELSQTQQSYVVSAGIKLFEALNINDPFYVLWAYEILEPIALKERERQKGKSDE